MEEKDQNEEKTEEKVQEKKEDEENKLEEKDYEVLGEEYEKGYDIAFKIIIIGNAGVGKSCLSLRGTKNLFKNEYSSTIGFEYFKFTIKLLNKDNTIIRLHIWDTCGQEIYRSLISNYYKNSSLAILVYAIDE